GANKLPLLPLNGGVVLPYMVVTITLESDEARAAVEAAERADRMVLLLPRKTDGYSSVGTIARVEESGQGPDGQLVAVLRGLHRGLVSTAAVETDGALVVEAKPAPDPTEYPGRVRELAREYRALIENILELRGAREIMRMLRGIENPGQLADMAGYSPDYSLEQKIEILETLDVSDRLQKVIALARETLADVSLKDKVRSEVTEKMEKAQREFYLRQQLEAIKKELGEKDGDVAADYRKRVEESGMPENVRKEVERELDRLERTSEQNPEYGWIRNYLDWMLDLPWDKRSED